MGRPEWIMDKDAVRNALAVLDSYLGRASDTLMQIEAEVYGPPGFDTGRIGYPDPEAALEGNLEDLKEMTMIVLDAAGMQATMASLAAAWGRFTKKPKGLRAIIEDHEGQYSYSAPLDYLRRLVQGLRSCTEDGPTVGELKRLEEMLRRTHVLVHRCGVTPSKEHDIQKVMHDYLGAAFLSFTKDVRIPKALTTFKPDAGVFDLGAAIEFKFVREKKDLGVAIRGVIEDIGGYQGSKDWNRFYSVFYQAKPFMTEEEALHDIKRSGGQPWTAIVVNGPTKLKRKTNQR